MVNITQWTNQSLEDFADRVKTSIVKKMVDEKLIEEKDGEDWSKTHTVILREKTFFRTISNLWDRQKFSDDMVYIIVVKD